MDSTLSQTEAPPLLDGAAQEHVERVGFSKAPGSVRLPSFKKPHHTPILPGAGHAGRCAAGGLHFAREPAC